MNYREKYEKAKEAGKTEQITEQIYKFEEEGQQVMGLVVTATPFTGGEFDAEVLRYVIDTDEGRISCVLGSATDSQLSNKKIVGKLVCITFHGKKTLSDGRSINRFSVEVF